ncbi:MAG: glycosyltransferase N-terminal domain-containing protein [Cytophagaceae bacterium]
MKYLYQLAIYILEVLFKIAALLGHSKASLMISGRKESLIRLSTLPKKSAKRVWFHCASLGEFEQARPVIESLKKSYSNIEIIVTFYSPSGYEIKKNYAEANYIFYLPADIPSKVKQFIDALEPDMAFFVKYEFWPNYLTYLQKNKIPLYLLSGVFRKDQIFFKWYGSYFKNVLGAFNYFFLQDYRSSELLKQLGFNNYTVSGDTRFDRVLQTKANIQSLPVIESFIQKASNVFVIGSSWPEDISIIAPYIKKSDSTQKFIIAPHDISEGSILKVKRMLYPLKAMTYSELLTNPSAQDNSSSILIIDNIGLLSSIYQYATIVHIGGAYGKGLHNILEPAVFGVPVLFGPHIEKFQEATWMTSLGCGFIIENENQWESIVSNLIQHPEQRTSIKSRLENAIVVGSGATSKVIKQLQENF